MLLNIFSVYKWHYMSVLILQIIINMPTKYENNSSIFSPRSGTASCLLYIDSTLEICASLWRDSKKQINIWLCIFSCRWALAKLGRRRVRGDLDWGNIWAYTSMKIRIHFLQYIIMIIIPASHMDESPKTLFAIRNTENLKTRFKQDKQFGIHFCVCSTGVLKGLRRKSTIIFPL